MSENHSADEVVFDADGNVVPTPDQIHTDFVEPEVEVYGFQTPIGEGTEGTELDPEV